MPGWRASNSDRIFELSFELKIGSEKCHPQTARKKNPAINSEAMAKYGIARVPVDYFHYKEFRYTNLDDAIAQATRQNGSATISIPKQLTGSGS
jgi:hypothetical protein